MKNIIKKILNEVRVPTNERVELYKDENIIVVVPLTHRALQKYATNCQWCINDDLTDWEDYHKGKHAVIIQRNPKKSKKGITGMETYGEIFILSRLDEGMWDWKTATDILGYDFGGSKEKALDYYVNITNDINNFATNIVYYSPENGIYDMEDNFLWNFNIEINDIPNVTPEVIMIMDDYLQKEETNNIQESVKKILKEQSEGLSKIELSVFNYLKKKKENPYIEPIKTYKSIQTLGFDEDETSELLRLYINNYQDNVDYGTLKNIDRSNEINDTYFLIFFNNLYNPEDVNWTHPPDEYDDEDPNRMEFYLGDYEYGDNTIFRWYAKDYWDEDNKNQSLSPLVHLEDLELQESLMETFGESWMKPFAKWVTNNFGVEVKRVLV